MSSVHRAKAESVEERERFSYWRRGSSAIGGVDPAPINNEAFQAEVVTRHLGAMIVFGLEAFPHRVTSLGRGPDQGAYFRIRFQRTGRNWIEGSGRSVEVLPGQWSIIDGSRTYSIYNTEPASQISLQVPYSELTERERELARSVGGPHPIEGSISHLLYHCLRLSLEDLRDAPDTADQELGVSMLDMFRIIIEAHAQKRERATMRETTERKVRSLIHRNLGNPDLSVEMIAAAANCSRRYVHKVFEGGESVTQYIWTQRLERCRHKLLEPDAHQVTLTEIAFEYGFRSSAHFSRAFRARYGVTPSAYRASAISAANVHPMLAEHAR
jgi:AraC-like DNA-binding protein